MAKEQDRTRPPQEADLASLPRWAKVAFAARCARRVYPIIESVSPKSPEAMIRGAQLAIASAEAVSMAGSRGTRLTKVPFSLGINASANSAMGAAIAADSEDAPRAALLAYEACITNSAVQAANVRAMWVDVDRLREIVSEGEWTHQTPVPASFFEELLWPHGIPEGFPAYDARPIDARSHEVSSKHELASLLTRWGLVAFAARCARRVQPLYLAAWPDAPTKHFDAIESAIAAAEAGAQGRRQGTWSDFASQAKDAARHAMGHIDSEWTSTAGDAVQSGKREDMAVGAANAAMYAAASLNPTRNRNEVVENVERCAAEAESAVEALLQLSKSTTLMPAYASAVRADLDRVREHASRGQWADKTPVPASFFNELLWPNGVPDGWPSQDAAVSNAARDDVPKEKDLESLPRWAKVAFAARCARRVQPLLAERSTENDRPTLVIVEQALSEAERACRTRQSDDAASIDLHGALLRAVSPQSPITTDAVRRLCVFAAAQAVYSAGNPDRVAEIATTRWLAGPHTTHGREANRTRYHRSIFEAVEQAPALSMKHALDACAERGIDTQLVVAAMKWDFERLLALVYSEGSNALVPASFFDEPLWPPPPGPPPGWPSIASEPRDADVRIPDDVMEIQVAVPANASDEEIKRLIREVVEAASKHHHAHGGSGLKRAGDVKVYEVVGVPQGVLP